MTRKIPIQNLYYLLLYAWDLLEESEDVSVNASDSSTLVDLFASVLCRSMDRILRRGLDRGFVCQEIELAGIRGKINLAASIKSSCFARGRTICEFDELTHDVVHNQIIKSTMVRLLSLPDMSDAVHTHLAETCQRLDEVTSVPLTDRTFRRIQLDGNTRAYRLPIEVCRIIHRAHLVDQSEGESAFRSFIEDERRMRRLFERFVRNFYRREQRTFRVATNGLSWARTTGSDEAMSRLPGMRTDIRLESRDRTVVIETKFVPSLFKSQFDKDKLISGHLYQLFAYLINIAARFEGCKGLEAILLYPTVSDHHEYRYVMFGHQVTVRTLDLNQDWQGIRDELLRWVE